MKKIFTIVSIAMLLIGLVVVSCTENGWDRRTGGRDGTGNKEYLIAALVWPAYHQEPLMKEFYRGDIGEWERIRDARPKFEGHIQPRYPLWGYVMEDNPEVMEMKIDVAAKYGVDIFIYDWYWYNEGPYLEEALDDGYLKAENNDKVKFYIMWANHDARTVWDIDRSDSIRTVWPGTVDRKNFETVVARVINKYFHHSSYFKIHGEPVFNIYDLANLIKGLGGIDQTEDALNYFRSEVKKSGFPGLHLQLMLRNSMMQDESVDSGGSVTHTEVKRLGFSSLTHYQWVHVAGSGKDYVDWGMEAIKQWPQYEKTFGIPYLPHVSIGWDNNPRFKERRPIVRNSIPEAFKSFLIKAKQYLDHRQNQPQIITVNAWNEWVEGSYLEPDMRHGFGYLETLQSAMSTDYIRP